MHGDIEQGPSYVWDLLIQECRDDGSFAPEYCESSYDTKQEAAQAESRFRAGTVNGFVKIKRRKAR